MAWGKKLPFREQLDKSGCVGASSDGGGDAEFRLWECVEAGHFGSEFSGRRMMSGPPGTVSGTTDCVERCDGWAGG